MASRFLAGCRQLFLVLGLGSAALLTPSAAAAEPEVLLEDDFATLNPALGQEDDTQRVKDNVLHVSVPSTAWNRKVYVSTQLGDADATIRARMPNFAGKIGHQVGLVFWAVSTKDFYAFVVADDGTAGVRRYRQGAWYNPVTFRHAASLKSAPGDWNDLRVVTQDNVATTYLNGKQFVVFKGRPPRDGGRIGMFSYPGDKDLQAEYSALRVVTPAGQPPAKVVVDADDVIFASDPALADPGWGVFNNELMYKGGSLFVKPDVDRIKRLLYHGDGDASMSIKAKVRMNDGDDRSTGYAGLMFWSHGKDDHYSFMVTEGALFQVTHYVNGKLVPPVQRKAVPAEAKLNVKDWIELEVVAGTESATMKINGTTVSQIQGKAPTPECQFGITAASNKTPCLTEFSAVEARRLIPPQAANSK